MLVRTRRPGRCEALDPVVQVVGNIDVSVRVNCHIAVLVQLSIAGAFRAELCQELGWGFGLTKYLDAVVTGVHNVDDAATVHGDARRIAEGRASAVPHTETGAVCSELLYAVIARVHHVDIALGVHGDALRVPELTDIRATWHPRAPLVKVVAVGREPYDPAVAGVRDVNAAVRRNCHAPRVPHLARVSSRAVPRANVRVPGRRIVTELADALVERIGHVDVHVAANRCCGDALGAGELGAAAPGVLDGTGERVVGGNALV